MAEYDLAVIGGGINGTGIARDAAGRGVKVLLVEQHDLASGASAASSKLVHGDVGGLLRGEFAKVRHALAERTIWARTAPHLVRPERFVMPTQDVGQSAWRVRAGLFLYDCFAGRRSLPGTRTLDLTHHPCGAPLRRRYTSGFEFSDCRVDDARLTVLNAVDAADRGAVIATRTRLMRAERGETWTLVLNTRGRRRVTSARAVVNATGGWAGIVNETVFRQPTPAAVRFAKGSHLVVRSLFEHGRGYLLPRPGRSPVYALPFAGAFTLIGATDEAFVGDPETPLADTSDIVALCEAVNAYFRETISSHDVVWSFAGVHARIADDFDGARVDDAAIAIDAGNGKAPLVTVYGGTLTTARRVSEVAVDGLTSYFTARGPWTSRTALPGGNFADFAALTAEFRTAWPFLAASHIDRLAGAYGRRTGLVVGDATGLDELGPRFGADLTGAEVRYLMRHEFAETVDDVLWRRSKLGLIMDPEARARLGRFMADELGA